MVDFRLEKNREHNSLCNITKDGVTIYLTEKELVSLLNQISYKRDDAFENLDIVSDLKEELALYIENSL